MIKLRPWQEAALFKAMNWLTIERSDKHFLINAAPGAGKTVAACAIADALIKQNEIDRVIVIAPRSEVVNQWAINFQQITGRFMSKVTGRDGDIEGLGIDICATWAALQGLFDPLRKICSQNRTLVICDEHHHAAVRAAWGENTNGAFTDSKFAIILTGTPIRSDGAQSVWLAYDDEGEINHPEQGTYTLSYGDAVDLGYCRPATFHRHEGKFTVDLKDGECFKVSGHEEVKISPKLARVPGLKQAIDFYRLAKTPQFKGDSETPLPDSYQMSMLEYASAKLDETRNRMPNAGGLVIAPTIKMAEYMAQILEMIEGEAPQLVHSLNVNAESKIQAFKNTDKRWIVSVAMISEGVDIPRLRLLVYLPNALTELAFRQAIGRVVRTYGPGDDTRAYVVMPSFETFEAFARRVENEMSPSAANIGKSPTTKICPRCHAECEKKDKACGECGYEFPAPNQARLKTCASCASLNPASATECHTCGEKFGTDFVISLDEALRNGAIVKGMDLDEDEVQASEKMAGQVREDVLRSGDAALIDMLNKLPDESFARVAKILKSCSQPGEGA